MKDTTTTITILSLLVLLVVSAAHAASPPDAMNYQGVLRDAAGAPLGGSHDMQFRFFTAAAAGDEVIVDRHLAANGQAVVVTDGMFNVALGTGSILDGSGPGTYTNLSEVFASHTDLWLEVQIGTETLSPRTQVTASGYALNAQALGGRSAGEFIDTSTSTQFKPGKLVAGSSTGTLNGFGLEAYGAYGGGYFEDTDDGSTAFLARAGYGVIGSGSFRGGSFDNTASGCSTIVASGSYGVSSTCDGTGGRFEDTSTGSFANVGASSSGIFAIGTTQGGEFSVFGASGRAYVAQGDGGIVAQGDAWGGQFFDLDESGFARVAEGNKGIRAEGTEMGGLFQDSDHSGQAHLGVLDWGIRAWGDTAGGYFESMTGGAWGEVGAGSTGVRGFGTTRGGYFKDDNNSGYSEVGIGDYGIRSYGNIAGGRFEDLTSSSFTLLANGDSGILGYGDFQGGYFLDLNSNNYGRVGYSIYKIFGSGTVSFTQNHPEDPDKVIVYHAPESAEVGVYTRGSAVLENGVARIALDETFQWTANPDIGLTAHLTPRSASADLYVESVSPTELIVRGTADATFDYMVWGLRNGFEEAAPVQPKLQESLIPSMADQRAFYANDESLRKFNSLERFSTIEARVRGIDRDALDLSQSRALLARVGEYDPAVHGPVELNLPQIGDVSTNAGRPTASTDPSSRAAQAGAAPSEIGEDELELQVQPDDSVWLPVAAPVEPGDLLALSVERPGLLAPAATMADPHVLGIAAGPARTNEHGVLEAPMADGRYTVVKVDAGYAAIQAGDLLVSSPTAGHAMRALEVVPGTIVGKAIDGLETGTGTIRVLLMTR